MTEDLIEERRARCLICLDKGTVELESTGETIRCPRGCEAPADRQHILILQDKPRLIQPAGWPRDLDGHPVVKP